MTPTNYCSRFSVPSLLLFIFGCLLFSSCGESGDASGVVPAEIALIPAPVQLQPGEGTFSLEKGAVIGIPADEEDWNIVATQLSRQLEIATGELFEVQITTEAPITIVVDESIEDGEAYRLSVTEDQIAISAGNARGAFYGVQSLLQLLPPAALARQKQLDLPLPIPVVTVEDAPRFSYRGMHLDVGRHFFDTEAVKRFLDLMALHKYNTFHWHLTEDQGWRIEIKQYPKLTEVGGFRKETLVGHFSEQPHEFDGRRYGGYYTQDEVREIVAYARERFITVVPEIELPGHAQAAIAAYPELGCLDEPVEVMTVWGVSENVYCPTEYTFNFLENVIDEVVALFPGEYFHIGGDECPKKQWEESAFCQELIKQKGLKDEFELQSYFIRRVEEMLTARGKRLIGWDEILEGGLAPNATVMSWRGMQGGIEAAGEGHDVVMTPTDYCYLDYYQSQNPDEPLAIGGFLPIEKVYAFNPVPDELAADKRQHIIGAQANIWTEYIPTVDQLFYMAYPRASAMAEVLWSPAEGRDFSDFSERLIPHFARLEAMGIKPAFRFFDPNGAISSIAGDVEVSLSNNVPGSTIHFTLDGTDPTADDAPYTAPISITGTTTVKAGTFINRVQKGKNWTGHIQWHQAIGKSIALTDQPAEKYSRGGASSLINGVFGSERQFGDQEWLGFEGKDLEVVIDLGSVMPVREVTGRFFEDTGAWIHFPARLEVAISNDGTQYSGLGEKTTVDRKATGKVGTVTISLPAETTTRYVKVKAYNQGNIPEGYAGAGYPAWLFAGELVVN